MSGYVDHAWRHRSKALGGTDPLEVADGSLMWPNTQDLMLHDSIGDNPDYPGSWSQTMDSTYFPGWYWGNTVDGANFTRYVRLGPRYSVWCINGSAEQGPDCAKVRVYLQAISEDAPGQGYDIDGQSMIAGSVDLIGTRTFYEPDTSYTSTDFYNAAQTKSNKTRNLTNAFRIMGADGAAVTANGTLSTADSSIYHLDGGAGIWAIKVLVSGKNASSTGYKLRMTSLSAVRHTSDQFSTG